MGKSSIHIILSIQLGNPWEIHRKMGSAMENHYEQLYLVGGLEHVFSIQLGTSSSQLTNSIIFQRG
jgi:hypothetical protein